MKMVNIVIIGHFSIDTIIIDNEKWQALGGVPAYSQVIPKLGETVGVVSIVGTDFPDAFWKSLRASGIDLRGIHVKGEHSTSFTNIYDKEGNRIQIVEHVAQKIELQDIPEEYQNAKWIHIGPILNEIDTKTILQLERNGFTISIDPQGFLRKRLNDGRIVPQKWKDANRVLERIFLLKCDEREIVELTGTEDIGTAAKAIIDLGTRVVIVTRSERGSIIFTNNKEYKIPAYLPEKIVDTTGAGDTYMMGFIVEFLKTKSIKKAGHFASAVASYNIETKGPTGFPSRKSVKKRMQTGKWINTSKASEI